MVCMSGFFPGSAANADRGIQTSTSGCSLSSQTQCTKPVNGAQEDGHPFVIAQETKHELASTAQHLARQQQPYLKEFLELHAEQSVPLLRFRLQQCQPGLDA